MITGGLASHKTHFNTHLCFLQCTKSKIWQLYPNGPILCMLTFVFVAVQFFWCPLIVDVFASVLVYNQMLFSLKRLTTFEYWYATFACIEIVQLFWPQSLKKPFLSKNVSGRTFGTVNCIATTWSIPLLVYCKSLMVYLKLSS